MTKTNDTVYPIFNSDGYCSISPEALHGASGLTKREYFAAMAMQGLCVEAAWSEKIHKQAESINTTSSVAIATYAVDLADALIQALNEEGGQS